MFLELHITRDAIRIALYPKGEEKTVAQSQDILPQTAVLLARNKKKIQSLQGILLMIGPVGFTRHRQAIACANACGALLNFPIRAITYGPNQPEQAAIKKAYAKLANQKIYKPLRASYTAPPTITPARNAIASVAGGTPRKR